MAGKEQGRDISPRDEMVIEGFDDPVQYEPEQIIPPFLREPVPDKGQEKVQRLIDIRERARKIINKIDELKSEIDERCGHLKVSTGEEKGSPLAQAMWRVFKENTTVVTYDHYRRAIDMRAQLAEEDRKELQKK